jgi:2-C-methyl-D-erythritol 2,4-cyclodiphosphate synthase
MNVRAAQAVGIGHDVHRLVEGRPLVLGGVHAEAEAGFASGDSDGDVLCHALIDALAGALADGDLGAHFPKPGDEGAPSIDWLREFARRIGGAGREVLHVDAFITLGTTRLSPWLAAMRTSLAAALGIDEARVSVKARTNDGLGLEGEGRAASATAVVLLGGLS